MNNILVENDVISFDSGVINLEIKSKELVINIKNDVVINELNINNNTNKLIINIEDNSKLVYNKFNKKAGCNLEIIVNITDNSTFEGNIAFIASNKNNIKITTNMNGNEIVNNLFVKCLTKNEGSIDIQVDGNVLSNTINNKMKESIKLLNQNNSKSRILPNMLVSTNEVEADHFVTISGIDLNELFYLNSKGISNEEATKLLEKGFILEIFNEDIQKIINNKE